MEKEGFTINVPVLRTSTVSDWFTKYESPEICEAMQIVCSACCEIMMFSKAFESRKERLKKEYEEITKAPVSAGNRIKEDSGVNPALKESASQFNDALLDEHGKKINRLGKDISRPNGIIHDRNEEINRKTKGCCELVAENVGLKEDLRNTESLLHDTRAANSRNLDTCFKNEDSIDGLKKNLAEKTKLAKKHAKGHSDSSLGLCKLEKELADKVVDKIDAHALKRAERALACKEKVIAEKDDVITDLGNELSATKKELEEKTKLVEMVRKVSKEYREYGIAAEKMIQKMAKVIVEERAVDSENFKEYRRLANGYRFNPQLPDFSEEEEKKLSPDRNTHPTEDNPEEIDIEKAVNIVRKAMKEGHTVTIDYND